ncbi:chemotaxis protein CheX [Gracilibacillus sp. YIM 98692]|uniref:chemotaxis protein CheX n=1 Tax=Gracilibacillus sp. YIM 98692 TaxID=2663532 RepID=UPI0013CFAC66|nr:chemotaxis protein CheX [Gracilibacillus sp. YIM 98692]
MTDENENEMLKELYNGSVQTIKNVVPIEQDFQSPKLSTKPLNVEYGVLIGFSGTYKGELVIQAEHDIFRAIGEALYGMQLSDDMLDSFSGELGNMIAGGISTHLANQEIHTDITHPTIISGNAQLTGFKRVLEVHIDYQNIGDMKMSLLLNH